MDSESLLRGNIHAIPVQQIEVDFSPAGPATLAVIDHLRNGGTVPPIHIKRIDNGRYKICDGRHRLLAYKMLGWTHVPARLSPLPVRVHKHTTLKD